MREEGLLGVWVGLDWGEGGTVGGEGRDERVEVSGDVGGVMFCEGGEDSEGVAEA